MQTPMQVAKSANVSVQSVRNWTRDYADLLSPQARGENGPRLFTDSDVDTILAIAALRKSGVPAGEIAERIGNQAAQAVIDIPPQESPQTPTTALQTVQDTSLPLQMAHNALQGHVQATDKRVDALERAVEKLEARQVAGINRFVSGVVVGGGLVLAFVALVLALTR